MSKLLLQFTLRKTWILVPVLLLTLSQHTWSQCNNPSSFGTYTAPASSGVLTLSTCVFGGEYNTINGAVTGSTYEFNSTGGTGNYITVRQGTPGGTVLGFGFAPLSVVCTVSGPLYLHYNTNAACATDGTCHTGTIQCTSCPSTPNDLCSGAININCGQTLTGSTTGTSIDAVPTCITTFGTSGGIWYTFIGDGVSTTLSLCGSAYDTKIGVYTGNCGGLVCVTGNDDFCGLQSQVTFTAVCGTSYYVLITGFSTNSGNFTLGRTCTPPDPCGSIPVITCSTPVTVSTCGSGAYNPVSSSCGFATIGQEKIYSFTPIVTGMHTMVVTAASGGFGDYFYKLASGGCNNTGWTCLAEASAPESNAFGPLTAGTTYYILFDPEVNTAASQTFRIDCPPVCSPMNLTTIVEANCPGSSSGHINLTVNGGTSPFTYDWSNDGAEVPDNDGQDLTGSPGTTYTVTVTDANNCTTSIATIVTLTTQMVFTIISVPTCIGGSNGSIDLTVSGGTPMYSYNWTNDGPDMLYDDPQDLVGLSAGTYTVSVSDANGCTRSSAVIVSNEPLLCGWSAEANGVGCNAGNSATYNSNTQRFTITSTNCYYPNSFTSDQLAFAQYDLCGNGSITAQVTNITPLGQGWAGVTMRESNTAGAKKAQLMTNLSEFSRREFRITSNGAAYPQQFPSQNRYWLRVTRNGNQFIMFISPNGSTWYQAGAQNITMGNCIEVGLVVTNYTANSTVTATFANVSVTGGNNTRPTINTQEDIFAAPDFSILPNPTNGWTNIELGSYGKRVVKMEIYSLQGKLLRSAVINAAKGREEIDLSTFANGMYLIRVRAEGLSDVTKRVVVNSNY